MLFVETNLTLIRTSRFVESLVFIDERKGRMIRFEKTSHGTIYR